MVKLVSVLVVITFIMGCSERSGLARDAVEAGLIHERQVDYWYLNRYPGDVVCGKWGRDNPKATRAGYEFFIVFNEVANTSPTTEEWIIFCNDDPAEGLYLRLGIHGLEDEKSSAARVYQDLLLLEVSLKRYRNDNGDYPSTGEGLKTLVQTGSASGDSAAPNEGKYLEQVPADPWGRPYVYTYSQLGGAVVTRYQLETLGADGVKGGRDENADIKSPQLRYLNHIESIRSSIR